MNNTNIKILILWICSFYTFASDIIGTDKIVTVAKNQSLVGIANKHQIGQKQILWANPDVKRWMPTPGIDIVIPGRHILPDYSSNGIIINLAEYRLYHIKDKQIKTYAVSIGRPKWETPQGNTKITQLIKDPTWTPPKSIRQERIAKGKKPYPDVVPAGPNNPLGLFALRLDIPRYLIHGTNKINGLGMNVSHGCIRMYPNDIKELFYNSFIGESVRIINEHIKVGQMDNDWYIQVFPNNESMDTNIKIVLSKIPDKNFIVNIVELKKALYKKSGMPEILYNANNQVNWTHHDRIYY